MGRPWLVMADTSRSHRTGWETGHQFPW